MPSMTCLSRTLRQLFANRPSVARRTRISRRSASPLESLEERVLLALHPLTDIPRLNSHPGAPVSVYLDFDGHTETQDWPGARTDGQSGPVITPVFDVDNDFTTFSDEELRMIEEVWYRVAEDYSPFNVNITTIDPGTYNNFETVLVSIGGDGAWIGSPGGIAWLNSFSNGLVNTVYVFSDNTGKGGRDHMKGTALAASHEVGHTLGLLHHSVYDSNGNKTAEYDSGTPTLGPIMGAPYGSFREVWANAPDSNGVTSIQDDVAVMTRAANQTFKLRNDDHGNTFQTATLVNVTSPNITGKGVIEVADDIDMFRFETNSGDISFTLKTLNVNDVWPTLGLNPGANLDSVLELYDANGTLIASDSPGNSLDAAVSANVTSGVYYLAVRGAGQYGDIGGYTWSGTVIPLPSVPVMVSPTGTLADPVPLFQWTAGANADHYELEVDNLKTGANAFYKRSVTGTSHLADQQFSEGSYRARVRTVAADGSVSGWSNYVAFDVDIPAPPQPTILRPNGDIGDSFPTFEWQITGGTAANYSLWVNNLATGQRVLYRTGYQGTSYQHFNPLPDGTYRAWVRAFNTIGESSPWSDSVQFTIDAPVPGIPTITAPISVTTNVNPRIVWTASTGTYLYDLWVDNRTSGQSQYIRNSSIEYKTAYYDPAALPQGTYTAWVRAINANGERSGWSAPYSFTVDILPPTRPTITGPKGLDGSLTITTQNPTFTWTAADRAATYDLWVNNVTTGQVQIIRNTAVKGTSYAAIANLPQGLYRAWVRGINSAAEVGPWSNQYTFTLDDPTPSVPVFTGPTANTAGVIEDATPTFTWSADVQGQFYDLWIDDNTARRTQVVRVRNVPGQTYTIPDSQIFAEHIYTAWVRAGNSSNEFSDWSQPYRIRIDVPNPTTPEIVGPGDTIRDSTPTFEWTHNGGSVRYELLVRDLQRQETIVLQVTSFTIDPKKQIASYVLPDAQALGTGTYRFWVRAFNSLGQASSWSTSKSFVIIGSLDPESIRPNESVVGDARNIVLTVLSSEIDSPSSTVVADTAARVPEFIRPESVVVVNDATRPVIDQPAVIDLEARDLPTVEAMDAVSLEAVMEELANPVSESAAVLQNSGDQDGEDAETGLPLSLAAAGLLIPLSFPRRQSNRREQ